MTQNSNNNIAGRTVWDFFVSIFSSGTKFYLLIIGILIGYVVGVSKIVDIQITWDGGGMKIENIKPQIEGEWELVNTVIETEYSQFEGMIIVWRMYLEQNGDKIRGKAIKVAVNNQRLTGNEKRRLEITSGKIEGNKVTVFFDEGRNSGKFEWLYCRELDLMKGKFTTSAALSNGLSIASKID